MWKTREEAYRWFNRVWRLKLKINPEEAREWEAFLESEGTTWEEFVGRKPRSNQLKLPFPQEKPHTKK